MDTKLFGRHQPGGLFSILDRAKFPTGNVWWVDSTATTTGANSVGYGTNPDAPFLTLAYAETQASAGDTIYLMPGHNEGIADAQIDLDLAGLSVIGLGEGGDVPRIDFDHANASIDIGANNVTLRNIRLLPSITTIAIGIDIEAGKTDTLLEGIEILPGEDGAGADEFVLGVDIKAGCSRTKIRNMKGRMHASAANANAVISLTGASDDIEIEGCDLVIVGAAAVAPIKGITTLSTNVRIRKNVLVTDAEPCIELHAGTTGVIHDNYCATDLAAITDSIVADTCYKFENYYCEVVNETGVLIGTPSADD
jgi:hypothetical protein